MKNTAFLIGSHGVWLKGVNVLEQCSACIISPAAGCSRFLLYVYIRPPKSQRHIPEDTVPQISCSCAVFWEQENLFN
jgi:hypothetical protein